MAPLQGLGIASTLLRQIASNAAATASKLEQSASAAQAIPEAAYGNGSAQKSVSSAIINAILSDAEQKAQDKSVKAVLQFIEKNYMGLDEQGKNSSEIPDWQMRVEHYKQLGKELKQQVLADPAVIHKLLTQTKSGRPDLSQERAIGVVIAELEKRMSLEAIF